MNEYQETLIMIARSPKESRRLFRLIAQLRFWCWAGIPVAAGIGFLAGWYVR